MLNHKAREVQIQILGDPAMAISKKTMVNSTPKKSTTKPTAKATGPIAASKLKTASNKFLPPGTV